MKKYIFLALQLTGVGGGQLYIGQKNKYLVEHGQKVFVFSINEKKESDRLCNKDIDLLTLKELGVCPQTYSKRKVKKIIDIMLETIDYVEGDEIIIESLSLVMSFWGEELAKHCNAKHIIYLIGERTNVSPGMIDYMEFKCLRKEVASINPNFIYGLYEKSRRVTIDSVAHLVAHMGDVVQDYEAPQLEKIILSDINICVFGRMSKTYVTDSVSEIILFANENSSKKLTVVYIGGGADKTIKKNLKKKYKIADNINAYFIDALSPVPKKIFSMFDVIIAGAGCASVSYRNGAKTIAMNVKDGGYPLGLMGYDMVSTLSSETTHEKYPLSVLLKKVIFEKYGEDRQWIPPIPVASLDAFDKHIEFVNNSDLSKSYYDYDKVALSCKDKLFDILSIVLGDRAKAIRLIRKCKNRGKK